MATLLTITLTIADTGTPALTDTEATQLLKKVIAQLDHRTLAPTYSAAAVALAVT